MDPKIGTKKDETDKWMETKVGISRDIIVQRDRTKVLEKEWKCLNIWLAGIRRRSIGVHSVKYCPLPTAS